MTLQEFRGCILTADPHATRYEADNKDGNYTVWSEYGNEPLYAGDRRAECAHNVQVDRFTKDEDDEIAERIADALDENGIAYTYLCDFEPDTHYIHHIYDCVVY